MNFCMNFVLITKEYMIPKPFAVEQFYVHQKLKMNGIGSRNTLRMELLSDPFHCFSHFYSSVSHRNQLFSTLWFVKHDVLDISLSVPSNNVCFRIYFVLARYICTSNNLRLCTRIYCLLSIIQTNS